MIERLPMSLLLPAQCSRRVCRRPDGPEGALLNPDGQHRKGGLEWVVCVKSKAYRQAILDGRLVLASASDPDARFTVASAMERNKYLYALSGAAVVVDSNV